MPMIEPCVPPIITGAHGVKAFIRYRSPGPALRRYVGSRDVRCKLQLDGQSHYAFDDRASRLIGRGTLGIAYQPEGSVKTEQTLGESERSITLVLPIGSNHIAGFDAEDPRIDRALARFVTDRLFFETLPLGAAIQRRAFEVLKTPSTPTIARLQSARIDELACLLLDTILGQFAAPCSTPLTAREARKVGEARGWLLADLSEAPDLATLCRHVGLNRTKLHAGFRALFGMSPYRLLHEARLAHADALLRQGATIDDVAAACGYGHSSNFSLAFKQHHGIAPSTVSRRD